MTNPESDSGGLICAFWLDSGQPCPDNVLTSGLEGRPVWLHFNLADARARRWLQEEADLPRSALDALMEPTPRIRSESAGEGSLAILGDLHHDFDVDPEGLGVMRIFVEPRRMITGRHDPLKTVDRVRRELRDGGALSTSPEGLFEHFIRRLAETLSDAVVALSDEVDEIEDEVLAGRFRTQGARLGRVRMSGARLRRNVARNRAALGGLRRLLTHGADGERRPGLHQAVEQMEAAAQDIDLVQERTRLLQEEMAGRLGEATNRDLFLLSVVTAALLPVNLVTGIFGMNVGGLPLVHNPLGFRWTTLGMAATVSMILWLLWWRRRL